MFYNCTKRNKYVHGISILIIIVFSVFMCISLAVWVYTLNDNNNNNNNKQTVYVSQEMSTVNTMTIPVSLLAPSAAAASLNTLYASKDELKHVHLLFNVCLLKEERLLIQYNSSENREQYLHLSNPDQSRERIRFIETTQQLPSTLNYTWVPQLLMPVFSCPNNPYHFFISTILPIITLHRHSTFTGTNDAIVVAHTEFPDTEAGACHGRRMF